MTIQAVDLKSAAETVTTTVWIVNWISGKYEISLWEISLKMIFFLVASTSAPKFGLHQTKHHFHNNHHKPPRSSCSGGGDGCRENSGGKHTAHMTIFLWKKTNNAEISFYGVTCNMKKWAVKCIK